MTLTIIILALVIVVGMISGTIYWWGRITRSPNWPLEEEAAAAGLRDWTSSSSTSDRRFWQTPESRQVRRARERQEAWRQARKDNQRTDRRKLRRKVKEQRRPWVEYRFQMVATTDDGQVSRYSPRLGKWVPLKNKAS